MKNKNMTILSITLLMNGLLILPVNADTIGGGKPQASVTPQEETEHSDFWEAFMDLFEPTSN